MQSAPTHHRFFVILALFVAALISSTAQAQDIVYPGCDVPKINSGRIFYVDPINGSMAGDGSAAKPWRTLAEVANANLLSTKRYVANTTDKFTDNTKAKVKEGDTVLLMSGDHGSVTLKGFNTDFITIAAAPNQQPVLRELFLTGATRWKIEGLRFQGIKLASDWRSMVHAVGGFFGPATQLIIKDNYITSHDDVNYWSQIDWKNNARNGITIADTTNCTSLTNNKIINTRFGANLSGPNLVFHNNKIDYIGGDGLRFTNSNMLITHNRITNNLDLGDGNHPDAMQGFVCANGKCDGTAKNIVIDSNTIIRQTDPNLKFPNGLQGICAFDSNWYNVTVTNNVIVTNAYHGITMNGLHGGLIANNTVLGDGDLRPAINVKRAKTGVPSSDVTVRNNIAAGISIDDGLINVVPDHNLIFGTFSVPGPTKHMWYEKPGVYGDQNVVEKQYGPVGIFTVYDTVKKQYDLTLRKDTPAIATGVADLAPLVDIVGTPRVANLIDLGAYALPRPVINGVCGSSSGAQFTAAPTTNFCAAGTQMALTGSGPWSWGCQGSNGGKTIQCTALVQTPSTPGTGSTLPKPDASNQPTPATTPVVGTQTITIKANARQQGTPKIVLYVDGQPVGVAVVRADGHFGQVGTYTFTLPSNVKPNSVELRLDGYKATEQKYVALGVFHVVYKDGKKSVDLFRKGYGQSVSPGASFYKGKAVKFTTDGSTAKFAVP